MAAKYELKLVRFCHYFRKGENHEQIEKRMGKFFALLRAVCMLASMLPMTALAAVPGNNSYSAMIEDCAVNLTIGKRYSGLKSSAVVKLSNMKYAGDASGYIPTGTGTVIPEGLSLTMEVTTRESLTIMISGTPKGECTDPINLVLPEDYFVDNNDVPIRAVIPVTVNPNAVWNITPPQEYDVTVTTDGNGTASASPAKGVAGTAVTLSATPNEGYQFKAWEVVSGGVTISNNRFLVPENAVKIKAVFEVASIDTVDITGITAPQANAAPDTSADDGEYYSAGGVTWLYYAAEFHGIQFGYNTAYGMELVLTPKAGYTFSADVTATVDGSEAVAALNVDGTVTVSYAFPATEKKANSNDVTQYTDLVPSEWYYETISESVSRSLFQGVSPTRFAPNEGMTRAMYFAALGRVNGQALGEQGGDNWYQDALDWAVGEGISDGENPMQNVTREQAVTMLYRYDTGNSKVDLSVLYAFNDVDTVSPWAQEAMAWAIQEGILLGDNHGNLNPMKDATRAEAATIFSRYQAR